ncbi:MAG: hypothetical protein JSR33_13595 [Proteobacteria bacterium]|nr:hypothetical protein [Pseudomonadota bacterium]
MLNNKSKCIIAGIFFSSVIALTAQAKENEYNYKVVINNLFPKNEASLTLSCNDRAQGQTWVVDGNLTMNANLPVNENMQECAKVIFDVNFLDSAGNSTYYSTKDIRGTVNSPTAPTYTVITFEAESKTTTVQQNQS